MVVVGLKYALSEEPEELAIMSGTRAVSEGIWAFSVILDCDCQSAISRSEGRHTCALLSLSEERPVQYSGSRRLGGDQTHLQLALPLFTYRLDMMSSRRESLFPPGSIGRNSPLPRTASHESLSTHPLLSPPPPASPSSAVTAETASPGSPRYVPYTPRQRVAPTSATTGTTMHPSISAPQQQNTFQGDATSKLQIMNLKAAAQRIELDAASIGWAILERLSTETDHGPEWNDIWNALSVSKATLLLPLEPYRSHDVITPDFVKDHIALCDGSTRSSAPIVTLSGLRGTLTDTTITIRSAISPTTEEFQALLSPASRSSALSALPPLPDIRIPPSLQVPPSPSSSSSSIPSPLPQYPTYSAPSHTSALPLPPRPSAVKPPLPPRPGARVTSGPPHPTSRLSNPFASLFGRGTAPASPSNTPVPLHPEGGSVSASTSLPTAVASTSGASSQAAATSATSGSDRASLTEHALDVPAYTISTCIDRAALGRELTDAITGEIRAALYDVGVPSWAVQRVERFAKPFHPLKRVGSGGSEKDEKGRKSGAGADAGGVGRVVSVGAKLKGKGEAEWVVSNRTAEERADELSAKFQEFYADLEDALWEKLPKGEQPQQESRGRGIHFGSRKTHELDSSASSISETGSQAEDGSDEKGVDENDEVGARRKEERVRGMMDAVERVLCSLFYDRLFLPANTDDASHDEALSSRIAAVNLLDLGLAHLGVDVGKSGKEVEVVIRECGKSLVQLDTACRAPADRASVLVAVHKVIVDGLSKLPPIGLRSEDEMLDEKTPRAISFQREHDEDAKDEPAQDATQQESLSVKVDDSAESSRAVPSSPTIFLSPDDTPVQEELLRPSKPDLTQPDSAHLSSNDPPSPQSSASLRSGSPLLAASARSMSPTPVSGDVILPLMIFAVVKANPPRLVSNLLYTQRFRRESAGGGEEGYCLINLMAVAEFLENVDLAALGLGESEKTVLSAAQLSPIPLGRSARFPGSEPPSPQVIQASLRGRVEQQVDAIAGSANKVISGVVDSSFGVLRSLLPGPSQAQATAPEANAEPADDATSRPGFGMLRRDTGFSIASLAASLPGGRARSITAPATEEVGQQMLEVPSRPGSSRSVRVADEDASASESETTGDEQDDDDDDEGEEEDYGHDTRSIRSFESMMSKRKGRGKGKRRLANGRMSLTDRLASMPGLSRLSQNQSLDASKIQVSPPGSRRSSLLLPAGPTQNRFDTPVSSRAASPVAIRISPPNTRFLNCTEDDLKVSEVGELLREYKRLAEAVRAMGGFHEE